MKTANLKQPITLHAKDECNRVRSWAVFERARRWNNALDRYEQGYRLVSSENVDFGDQRFWDRLPIDSADGVTSGTFLWSRA